MNKIVLLTTLLVASFCFGQTPIQVFNFENTMSNTANTSTFVGQGANPTGNTSFSTGATGRPNSALSCAGGGTSYLATISNLPSGNSPRTISFWYRNDCTQFCAHRIFSYGSTGTNQAYGANIGAGGIVNYGFGNDLNGTWSQQLQGVWYLYVCTFDGTNATIYRNGVQLATANKAAWNTLASTTFRLGSSIEDTVDLYGAIDDLKIYDVALNSTQVSAINNHRHANITASATLLRETNLTTSSATFNYGVDAGNLPTNVVLRYGTTTGVLNNVITMQSGVVNGALTEFNYNLVGLSQGTTYYYTLTAENESGKTVLAERLFNTAAPFPSVGLVAYFPFENGLSSHDNSHAFTTISASGPTFTGGRVGNGAMFGNDTSTGNSTAIINDTSINDAITTGQEYTVAFWADNMYSPQVQNFPTMIEMFSSIYVRQVRSVSTTTINRGYANGSAFYDSYRSPNINTGLNHIAIVHKSGTSNNRVNCALYINGVLEDLVTSANPADVLEFTRFNTKVTVGGAVLVNGNEQIVKRYRGIIDELYIYNRAVSINEIVSIMNNTNQSLASKKFNQDNLTLKLYPNPANSILNIDLATEIKTVEIYSLQGQKVFSGKEKQVNISNLSNGLYMVKVVDDKGAVATQKFIKK